MELRANFLHGFLIICPQENKRVKINSATSSLLSVNAGIPQGSMLGSILFLVYVNDIAENLLSLVRLFADDSSLFFSATNPKGIEKSN